MTNLSGCTETAAPNLPIPYMARTREYYRAIGYDTPYRWAHNTSAPFQPLKKPLGNSRVALVTTAARFDPSKGDQGPGAPYNGSAKFFSVYDGDSSQDHDLRISHIAYDRKTYFWPRSAIKLRHPGPLVGLPTIVSICDPRSRARPPKSRTRTQRCFAKRPAPIRNISPVSRTLISCSRVRM
jgi:hypothetical protein